METYDLINLFIYEFQEEMQEYSTTLFELEKSPASKELLNDLFINVHTIKGSSKTLLSSLIKENHPITNNVDAIAKITHAFEDYLDDLKSLDCLSEDNLNIFFDFANIINKIKELIEDNSENMYDETTISRFYELIKSDNNVPIEKNTKEEQKHFFNITLTSDENYKHGYLTIVYRDIQTKYEQSFFMPTPEDLLKNKDFDTITIQIVSDDSAVDVLAFLKGIEFVGAVQYLPYTPKPNTVQASKSTIREYIDSQNPLLEAKDISKKKRSQPIRIEANRIDNVLKHTSKLVILKNKLDQFLLQTDFLAGTQKRKELESIFSEINSHVDYLQSSVLEIRMTPFGQLFSRFPNDIRSLSKELNKPIKFTTSGDTTEIDKSILDELFEPFMHLIKNSVSHGIESPEERIRKGKNPEGNISIHAKHDKNRVIITIKDDGKGIDLETVKNVAIQKNLITASIAKNFSKDDILKLIFKSGVSTSETVTEYSGRGVGMDAVRKKIDAINGTISVSSIDDVGTTITLLLPLTTAIIEGMVTKIHGDYFTFPLIQVEEVINIKKSEVRSSSDKTYFFLKDKEIPIIFSNKFFNLENKEDSNNPFLKLMILRSNNYIVGFTINEFLGQQSIVVKNMHPFVQTAKGISSCHILGDGAISLIVDSNDLLPYLTSN